MDKLVDMKRSAKEMKAERKEMSVGMNGQPDPYPWGLNIRLERDELDKLGIKDLPDVGDELHLTGVAKVTSVNQSAAQGRDPEASIALTLTMLCVSPEAEEPGEKNTPAKEMGEMRSVASKYKG